jgi:hypothetical protein
MFIDNPITLFYIIFNNVTEYFSILFWGLGFSFSILLLIKLLSGERLNANIENEINDEMDIIEIGKFQDNNEIKISATVGEDYRNNEIWICSECNTLNEIYMIKCKKCGKIID